MIDAVPDARPDTDAGPARSGTRRAGSSVAIGLGLLALLCCWAAATARYGGADEPAHVLRAYAVAHGDVLGGPTTGLAPGYRAVTVPASLGTGDPACYRHDPTLDSTCAAPTGGGDERVEVATSAGTNPPLYYALVGGLARLVGGADDTLAYRLAAASLVAVALALVAHRMAAAAGGGAAGVALVAVATPSCWALWGVVNPNALEIALFALAATGVVSGRTNPATTDAWWIGVPLGLAIAMRPIAAVWAAAVLVVTAVEWRRPVRPRHVVVACAPAVAAGLSVIAWSAWSALVVSDERTAGSGSRLTALRESIGGLPRTGLELVTSMGWLEYRAPWPAVAAWAAAVVIVVRARPSVATASWLALAAVLAVFPVVFEVALYERIGLIWQGRYGLPVVAVAAVLAVGMATRAPTRRHVTLLVSLAAVTTIVTYWTAARRAAVGTDGSWWFHDAARTSRLLGPGTWAVVHTALVLAGAAVVAWRLSSSAPSGSTATGRATPRPRR